MVHWYIQESAESSNLGALHSENNMLCQEGGYPQEVAAFAEQMANVWEPHPIFVMDVASTPGGLKLMEVGSANCAGFYKSDPYKVIEAMARIAVREASTSHS